MSANEYFTPTVVDASVVFDTYREFNGTHKSLDREVRKELIANALSTDIGCNFSKFGEACWIKVYNNAFAVGLFEEYDQSRVRSFKAYTAVFMEADAEGEPVQHREFKLFYDMKEKRVSVVVRQDLQPRLARVLAA